jgi:hypothetical protein
LKAKTRGLDSNWIVFVKRILNLFRARLKDILYDLIPHYRLIPTEMDTELRSERGASQRENFGKGRWRLLHVKAGFPLRLPLRRSIPVEENLLKPVRTRLTSLHLYSTVKNRGIPTFSLDPRPTVTSAVSRVIPGQSEPLEWGEDRRMR